MVHNIVGIFVTVAVALALWYVVQTYLFGQKFDLVPAIINIVVIIVILFVAGMISQKVVHSKGISVSVAGRK